MADLDELFRAQIERDTPVPVPEVDASGPDGGGGIDLREQRAPGSDVAEVGGAVEEASASDDDLLLDVRSLVNEWNADHEVTSASEAHTDTPRRRSRLASARASLIEHIGAQPEAKVVPPEPDPISPVAAAVRPVDAPADVEGELIPPLSRRQQRQARREIDRLERECARRPVEGDEPEEDVKLLGAAPAALAESPVVEPVTLIESVPIVGPIEVVEPVIDPTVEAVVVATAPIVGPVDFVEPKWADEPDAPTAEPELRIEPVAPAKPLEARPAPAWKAEPEAEAGLAPGTEEDADDFYPATRRERRKEWKQAEHDRRVAAKGQVRFPIFTRSVLVWMFIFMVCGVAFGASAAFWWSQFNSEVAQIRGETSTFSDQVENAAGVLESQRADALSEIETAMAPVERLAQPGLAPQVASNAAASVFFVETLDDNGAPSVGSAFVVGNTEDQSLLLTSLASVAASTTAPGPGITLRQGDQELPAELWSWDVDTDVALLLVDNPDLPALPWASDAEASKALGSGVFAVGGLGGSGATAVPGLVVDQSAAGFQHTATLGTAYAGGPILTNSGKVLGIASLAYQPLGFDPGDVHFSVPVGMTCTLVLTCGEGGPTTGETGGAPIPTEDDVTTTGTQAATSTESVATTPATSAPSTDTTDE